MNYHVSVSKNRLAPSDADGMKQVRGQSTQGRLILPVNHFQKK
jgi:hypothetical protein